MLPKTWRETMSDGISSQTVTVSADIGDLDKKVERLNEAVTSLSDATTGIEAAADELNTTAIDLTVELSIDEQQLAADIADQIELSVGNQS